MQLKHLKLAGFKSFVDSTRISFPTNMVAVVGPNGCGKSNIIDAVRWVLGELSAKNLRGDSMSDVIFNGTETRKASGQCSIELLFDNSLGKLGGEYSKYNEISVKRIMTKDGQSDYYINNTRVRRKDVQDMFLGTGLGSNSYAIIEQGMISKIVSAKPEELRMYIEEVAGISKYKDRRKETESKVKRTKENIARVKDIREEISRAVKRLENQAKAAERYNSLVEKEEKLKLDIAIIDSLNANHDKEQYESQVKKLSKENEMLAVKITSHQSMIDQIKTEHQDTIDAYDGAQKEFYLCSSELSKSEEIFANLKDEKILLQKDIESADLRFRDLISKTKDFDELSPKEKVVDLINQLLDGLGNDSHLKNIVLKLKDILNKILNLASEQSKDLADEVESRRNILNKRFNEILLKEEELSGRLTELAASKLVAEKNLANIRKDQSVVDEKIQSLESERGLLQLDERANIEKINNLKVEMKAYEVNFENHNKVLRAHKINIDELDYAEFAEKNRDDVEASLFKIQKNISSLGAINLAAPDEIEAESKRIGELDAQLNDLNQALEKLQYAIKKIDLESKIKFEESFKAVNQKIGEIFPKLFDGGKAELRMLEEDTLNTGIMLMANPPGKKNTNISQLSGGEKALTALSLVFALFELNPSPFCLLDEVDAPLDDLNTSRFVEMVDQLSTDVQFIFITHNKISMEKSDYLMGITMQEPGVSRVVSVNVNEAVELAAS